MIPNKVKYNTNPEPGPGTIKKDNFDFGVADQNYGPTSTTGYWNGITPPTETGYTVYAYKELQGPSIRCANDDTDLLDIANDYGADMTNPVDALNWFQVDPNYAVVNISDYPNVVTDGLLNLIDAGSTLSYPRTGSTATDICSVAGPVQAAFTNWAFSETAGTGGAWVFDGTFRFGEIPYPAAIYGTSAPDFSIDIWFIAETVSGYSTYTLLGYPDNSLTLNVDGSAFIANFGSGGSSVTSTGGFSLSTWTNIVFTYDSTLSEGKFYINGVLDSTHSISGFTLDLLTHFIGLIDVATDTNYFSGNISVIKNYTKPISQVEVSQNYNAYKVRYI